jgi:acetyl esterase/lipase
MTVAPTTKLVLEPAAQEFADATANPPFLFDLGPEKGRETVDEVQSGEIGRPDVDITDTTVPGCPFGEVSVRILRPRGATGPLPVIVYIQGAGWVFGNAHTRARLAARSRARAPPRHEARPLHRGQRRLGRRRPDRCRPHCARRCGPGRPGSR